MSAAELHAALDQALTAPPTNSACGPVEIAHLIPDCPLEGVCFTAACEAHNLCYGTCGASKAICDALFLQDMVFVCLDHYLPQSPGFLACRDIAFVYSSAVSMLGAESFAMSQMSACAEEVEFPEKGACCIAGAPPTCVDAMSYGECVGLRGVHFSGMDCDEVADAIGGCPTPANDDCEERRLVCAGQTPEEGVGYCTRDATANFPQRTCRVDLQDCALGEVCLPLDGTVYDCGVETDNRLATTDGPTDVGGDCADSGVKGFQADVWYEYVVPCSGNLRITMCESGLYDSMLAVYGVSEGEDGGACPGDGGELLACDDDSCSLFGAGLSAVILEDMVEGAKVVIRVGGWSNDATSSGADRGSAELNITCLCQ